MKLIYHKDLAKGRWFEFSLPEQIANTGSEVLRAIRWEKKDKKYSQICIERALELNVKSIVTPSETGRSVLKALRIAKEYGVNKNKLKLVVATHPLDKTWGSKGDIPIGLYHPKNRRTRKCQQE